MSVLTQIQEELQQNNTTLVAVSKTKSCEAILALYDEGQRIFGENKVQELVEKQAQLPKDIQWHLIGHLQTNKVKYIIPFVDMIHSVDSLHLLREINKQANLQNKMVSVLLQVHIAQEDSKFGLDTKELVEIMEYYTAENSSLSNVTICGLMGMATFTEDEQIIRHEFKQLMELFTFIKNGYLIHKKDFKERSMGMSGDYKIAMQEGSTMVRIGSLLFGDRK